MKKIIKRILLVILVLIVSYALGYVWRAFPIISAYNAKTMCSCTMIAGRLPQQVKDEELHPPLLAFANVVVDYSDSSVSADIWGLAARKAIYRKGLGCTLINEMEEDSVRNQSIQIPKAPVLDQDTIPWPMGNSMVEDSIKSMIDFNKLNHTIDLAFEEPGEQPDRRTRAIIVVYDGNIIAERYAPGFDKTTPLIGWSMTKSIMATLVGIYVKKSGYDIHQPLSLEPWQNDGRKQITLNHLLHANSGLEWEEKYGGPSPATTMLFKKKSASEYAMSFPLDDTPEKKWYYSSGTTNIISWILRNKLGDKAYYSFPYDELFYKIGMFSMVLEPDAGGTFVGSSFSFATARDWARFGLLYANDGVWMGEQILPEGWVDYCVTPAKSAPQGKYGAQWWLNAGEVSNPVDRMYPSAPVDLFWADGYEGQNVFIIPSEKLVIVKLSMSHGDYLDDDAFLAGIISSLPH